jgi:hypothetical protein
MTETPESAPAVVTPGQAAYERHQIVLRRRFPGIAPIGWDELDAEAQADWVSIARDAAAAQEPQPAPGCPSCGQRGGPYCEPHPSAKRVSHEPIVPAEDPRFTAAKEYAARRVGSYITAPLVQRHVRVGFATAVRLIGELADAGLIAVSATKGRYTVLHVPATATETITKGEA